MTITARLARLCRRCRFRPRVDNGLCRQCAADDFVTARNRPG